MINPVFEEWFSEQQQRRDDVGELSSRLLDNPEFGQDFYFSNSLSQKLEWLMNQGYTQKDQLNFIRAFEEWAGGRALEASAFEGSEQTP